MFDWHPAAADLRHLVSGYWFVVDVNGRHAAAPIKTAPSIATILTLHMGNANRCADGTVIPAASLLGPQRRSRTWYSQPGTSLVMAILTPPGVVRLIPSLVGYAVDDPVDMASIVGDRVAAELSQIVSAASAPSDRAGQLDAWFRRRLAESRGPAADMLQAAYPLIVRYGDIAGAAAHVGLSVRQLQRVSARMTGLTPKELFDIERLRRSLAVTQRGEGDSLAGYADQSHQIRSWRRRLGTTPGAYLRNGPSAIRRSIANLRAWLHYL